MCVSCVLGLCLPQVQSYLTSPKAAIKCAYANDVCCRLAGYGIFVLVVEIIGATTVMLYGVNLLFNPCIEKFEEDPNLPCRPKVR